MFRILNSSLLLLCMWGVHPSTTDSITSSLCFPSFILLPALTSGSFLTRSITCCFQPDLFLSVQTSSEQILESVFIRVRVTACDPAHLPRPDSSAARRCCRSITARRIRVVPTRALYRSLPIAISNTASITLPLCVLYGLSTMPQTWYDSSLVNWWSTVFFRDLLVAAGLPASAKG